MSGLIGESDVSSDAANFQPAAFQGYLQKKSPKGFLGKHLWQRRFFVLEKEALSYYKDKQEWAKGTTPIGVVRVDMIRDIQIPVESSHYGMRFDILAVGGHLFELMAPSEKSCTQWVRALREEVAQRGGVVVEALRHVKDDQVAPGYWKKKQEEDVKAMHAHAEKAVPVPLGKDKLSRQHSRSNSRSRNFVEEDDEETRDRAAALAVMMAEEEKANAAKAAASSSSSSSSDAVVVGGGSMVAASSGGYASMFKKKQTSAPVSAGHTPPPDAPPAPAEDEEMSAEERAQQFLKRQYTLGATKASKGRVGEGAAVTSAAAAAATAMAASATASGAATPQRRKPIASYGDSDSDNEDSMAKRNIAAAAAGGSTAAATTSDGAVIVKIHGDDDDDDEDGIASPSASASAAGAAAASAGSPAASASSAVDDTPYISTVLWKESPGGLFKPWQKRLFALKDGAICYYKTQGLGVRKSNLAGQIPIHQITKVIIVGADSNTKNTALTDFNLLTMEGRVYKLRSESAEITKQWVAFIQACDPRRLGCTFPGLVVRETVESAEQSSAIKPLGGIPTRGRLMATSALSGRTVVSVMPSAAGSSSAATANGAGAAAGGVGVGGLTSALPPTPDDAASQEIVEEKTFWNFLRNKHSLFSIFYVKKKAAFPRAARGAMFVLDLLMNLMFVYVFIIYADKHDGKPSPVNQILSIILILVVIEMVLGWLLRLVCFDRSLSVVEQHIRLGVCAVALYALFIALTAWQWTLLPQNVAIMALVRFFLSALGVIVAEIMVWGLLYACATECCPCLTLDAGSRSMEDIQAEKDEIDKIEKEKQRKIDIANRRAKMHKKIDKRVERDIGSEV